MSNSTLEVRIRAVRAIQRGASLDKVAEMFGFDRSTVYRWAKRAEKKNGVDELKRAPVTGRPRAMSVRENERLQKIVLRPATEFRYETDLWTCGRIAQVAKAELGVNVSKMTILRRLHEAGLSYQKPERIYFEASERLRRDWLSRELPKIKKAVKKHRAILYFEDEANISLTSVLGKTWAPQGQTPRVRVTGRRGGVAAMSAISIKGNLVFQLHEGRVASDEVIDFLEQLLAHHPRRHLVVVMDQASAHTSKKTKDFISKQRRLHVFYLPPYSPDWNPDEKVWNHLKHQELKSHQARTVGELKSLARRKLKTMARNKSQMRGIFFRCFVAELLL